MDVNKQDANLYGPLLGKRNYREKRTLIETTTSRKHQRKKLMNPVIKRRHNREHNVQLNITD